MNEKEAIRKLKSITENPETPDPEDVSSKDLAWLAYRTEYVNEHLPEMYHEKPLPWRHFERVKEGFNQWWEKDAWR